MYHSLVTVVNFQSVILPDDGKSVCTLMINNIMEKKKRLEFGFVSLLNSILTFVDYLMLKPSS